MIGLALASFAIAMGACFDPQRSETLSCSRDGLCPDDLECVNQVCVVVSDAAQKSDAFVPGIFDAQPVSIDAQAMGEDAGIVSAKALGQSCEGEQECPTGYLCVDLLDKSGSVCSLLCGNVGETEICGEENGFPGPGKGVCHVMHPTLGNLCGILCSPEDECPNGLVCRKHFLLENGCYPPLE